jgi:hypothetical protein
VTVVADYLTQTEFMDRYELDSGDVPSAVIGPAITAASALVDAWCFRTFDETASEERFYTMRPDYGRRRWVVDIDDTFDDTLTVEVDDVATTAFTLEPRNAAAQGRPFTMLVFDSTAAFGETVAVTAAWGWGEIPEPVKVATGLQTNRFISRRKSPFGIAGFPDMGSELRLLSRLDVDAQLALTGFRRRRPFG